jgi:hypothetical protein
MSATPRTDAARGFYDMETAVDAEEMAKIETELAEARAKLADELTRSAYANNQSKTLADVVMRQTDEINGLWAEVEDARRLLANVKTEAAENLKLVNAMCERFLGLDDAYSITTLNELLLGKVDTMRAEVERLERLSAPPETRDFIGTIDGGDISAGWLMIKVNVSPEGYRVGQDVRVILPVVEKATNQPELPL